MYTKPAEAGSVDVKTPPALQSKDGEITSACTKAGSAWQGFDEDIGLPGATVMNCVHQSLLLV